MTVVFDDMSDEKKASDSLPRDSEHFEPMYLGYQTNSSDNPPLPQTQPLRTLDSEEEVEITEAIHYVARLDGLILENGLPDALLAIHRLIEDLKTHSISDVTTSPFKIRVRRTFNNWFAEFTAFRADLELRAVQDPTAGSNEPADLFQHAYRNHPEFRLTWQMRNISQHRGSVGAYLRFQTWLDTTDESLHSWFFIKTEEMFAAHRGRKDWDECEAMWIATHGASPEVDVRRVFGPAYRAVFRILSHFIFNRVPTYEAAAKVFARAGSEAGAHGYPVLYRMRLDRDAREVRGLDLLRLEPKNLRAAWVSMECA
ncbi:hypothetical protein [Herbiconiux liukaitaii]|uniref:hypothetical protein n=1 Tax=Herbiconiux liukaitaii TaxID=3342799 RepID=UPI0035B8D72B